MAKSLGAKIGRLIMTDCRDDWDQVRIIMTGIGMDAMDGQLTTRAIGPSTQLETLEENARLREALDECKARILELNREDNRFTDRDARMRFEDLYNLVEDWLNDFLDRGGKYSGWEKGTPIERNTKRYNSVGIPKDLFPLSRQEPDLLSAVAWLSEKRCCDRFMLSLVTWGFLRRFVFEENLPSGSGTWSPRSKRLRMDGDIPFIDGVHKVLVGVDQSSRRLPRASKWRSETLRAMIRTPQFCERQSRNIEELTRVFENESLFFARPSNTDGLRDFCRQCVRLATDLQTELLCCLSSYEMRFPSLPKQALEGMAKEWNYRHISTWRAVPNHADVRPVKALIPGLYRKTTAEGQSERVEVVRPLMIVCDTNDDCVIRANQSPSSSRATRHTSRSREATFPGDEGKSRKSGISSWLRPKKKNASWPSSDERGAQSQMTMDAESDQRIVKESYNEDDGKSAWAVPDQDFSQSPTMSDEPMSSSHGGASRQSLARRCPDFEHDGKSSRDRRDITDMPTDRSPVRRERPEYRGHPGVMFADTMHDVGLPSRRIGAN